MDGSMKEATDMSPQMQGWAAEERRPWAALIPGITERKPTQQHVTAASILSPVPATPEHVTPVLVTLPVSSDCSTCV